MSLPEKYQELLHTLKNRFELNMQRHPNLDWNSVINVIKNSQKIESLFMMEESGGEPDVVEYDGKSGNLAFFDCSAESPKGRRSLCYDQAALESRKEFKPADSAMNMAINMGIQLLNEEQYRHLQTLGQFDLKTSSWVATPDYIRKLGGAVFCDRRYDTVFLYHNGAESYYAARGFRGILKI